MKLFKKLIKLYKKYSPLYKSYLGKMDEKRYLNSREKYEKASEICNKIYIARNISMSQEKIIEQLKEIDKLFCDNNGHKDI